jgi:hypothetical protein
MTTTSDRVVADVGLAEIQQTVALRTAYGSPLVVDDDDDWFDVSEDVTGIMPGSPAARATNDEFNISQIETMVSRSKIIPPWTPSLVAFEKNGVAKVYPGNPQSVLLKKIFEVARDNDIPLVFRYSIRGETGDPLYTYGNLYVLGITDPEIKPGQANSAVYTVEMRAESRTPSTVA